MKKLILLVALLISVNVYAAEVKLTATIEKITVNGNEVTVVVGGKTVIVKDELTVAKLKDKRIVVGDEVRVKFDDVTKKTILFRKTAGC